MTQEPEKLPNRVEQLKPLDTKDPGLVELKEEMWDIAARLRGSAGGALKWLVSWAIEIRWVNTRQASYAHEIAWVLDKPTSSIVKSLGALEEVGEVEFAGFGKRRRGLVKRYMPTRRERG